MKVDEIKELGEKLLQQVNSELLKSLDNAKIAEGAIKGIKLFFDEIVKHEQHSQSSGQEKTGSAE